MGDQQITYRPTAIHPSIAYLDQLRELGRRPRGDGGPQPLPRHGEGRLDGGHPCHGVGVDRWG